MCARLFLPVSAEDLAEFLEIEVEALPPWEPRYNIAPGQDVLVVRAGASGAREARLLRWGLVPRWAGDPRIARRLINARSETAARQPAFRDALRTRRCVVPAAGFYEWKKIGRMRQPYAVRLGGMGAIAGLWESWSGDGRSLETCSLLTTRPNARVAEIHDRMPVWLDREQLALWLDPRRQQPGELEPLMRPYPAERTVITPVSTRVNRTDFDDASGLEPVDLALPAQGRLF